MKPGRILLASLGIVLSAVAAFGGVAGAGQPLPDNCGRECTNVVATFFNAAAYAGKIQYQNSVAKCDQRFDVRQVQDLQGCYASAKAHGLMTVAGLSVGSVGGYVAERMLSERARVADAAHKRYNVGYAIHGIIPRPQYQYVMAMKPA